MISEKRVNFQPENVSVFMKIGVFFLALKSVERGHFSKWRTLMGYTLYILVGVTGQVIGVTNRSWWITKNFMGQYSLYDMMFSLSYMVHG